ncbi:MAG TPA: sugar nucleotide-binding protein [Aggregatilineales bacterium]|nr:sugar nucleotide-binding protein [Aggregatilineales bacterium]
MIHQRRLLITGASGDLGRPLSALAESAWQTTSTYHTRSDVGGGTPVRINLRDRAATLALVQETRPDVIIHAAASDRSPDMAATNREAAQNITAAAQAVGARLIALSTDMVFDGTCPPYAEDDPPAPLSEYGRVKAENESFFLRAYDNCLVVRTSLIYDFTPDNRQAGWLLDTVRAGRRVTLFVDEVRNPVWSWNLAEALLELAAGDATGILHVAGPEPVTRWELGTVLLEELGLDPAQVAEPVRAAEVAPHRPRDLTLCLDRATSLLRTSLLPLSATRDRARRA